MTLQWHNPFVTPPWLKAWWRHFSDDNESLLLLVSAGNRPLGVAPLMVRNGTARFMGSTDLCDSGDFVVANGTQELFFQEILRYLEKEGINRLVLEQVRPDSRSMPVLYTSCPGKWLVCFSYPAGCVGADGSAQELGELSPGSWR